VYHVDTATRLVRAYDVDVESGTLGNKRTFAETPDDRSLPDGLAVGADGGVRVESLEGGAIRRHGADGNVEAEVAFPVTQVASCAFVGEQLLPLVVTSVREGLDSPPQLDGATLIVDVGVVGAPVRGFAI
jgi:sugar lactone lactonase YvrE